jgi:hypothetical protein
MARKAAKKAAKQMLAPTEQLTDVQVLEVAQECLSTTPESNSVNELKTQDMPESTTLIVCPLPGDPSMGDKTPAVMDWYREHAPEEYARRYGNRVTPHSSGERQVIRQDLAGPDPALENEEEPERKPKVITE